MNTPEQKAAIAERFQELYELFDKPLSDGALRLLVRSWEPRDLDRLERAIDRCLPEPGRKFAPTIGELIAAVGDLDPTADHARVKGYWLRRRGMLGRDLLQDEIDEACRELGIPEGKIKQGEVEL